MLQTEGHVCSLQIRQHWARASEKGHMHVRHLSDAGSCSAERTWCTSGNMGLTAFLDIGYFEVELAWSKNETCITCNA